MQADSHHMGAPGGIGRAGAIAGSDAPSVEGDSHIELALGAWGRHNHGGTQVEPCKKRAINPHIGWGSIGAREFRVVGLSVLWGSTRIGKDGDTSATASHSREVTEREQGIKDKNKHSLICSHDNI